jgi:small-conductance mechanosensitive channel
MEDGIAFGQVEKVRDEFPPLYDLKHDEIENVLAVDLEQTRDETLKKRMQRWPYMQVPERTFPNKFKYLMRFRWFFSPFTISFMFILIIMFLIWTTVALPFSDARLGGSPVWVWGTFLLVTVLNYMIISWVMAIVGSMVKSRNYKYLKLFFYMYKTDMPLAWTVSSICELAVLLLFRIGPLNAQTYDTMYQICGSVLTISIAVLLKLMSTRMSLAGLDPNLFWFNLASLFWKRRTIRLLLEGLRELRRRSFMSARILEERDVEAIFNTTDRSYLLNSELLFFGFDDPMERWVMKGLSGKEKVSGNSAEEIIRSARETNEADVALVKIASRLALCLFDELHVSIEEPLSPEMILPLFDNVAEGEDVLALLNINNHADRRIYFQEAVQSILVVLRDSVGLSLIMDTKSAGGSVLSTMFGIIYGTIALFVIFGIFGLDFAALLTPALTFVLGFSFVFGESAKRVWHAFIEVVVTKRFDVGDYLVFAGYEEFEVDSITLLDVSGFMADGQRISIPTWKLWDLQLLNHQRSNGYRIRLYVRLGAETSDAMLKEFGNGLLRWIKHRPSTFIASTFQFWGVTDFKNDAMVGWPELIDLRSKTICLQVNLLNTTHVSWEEQRIGETLLIERIKASAQAAGIVFQGLADTVRFQGDANRSSSVFDRTTGDEKTK